jgi:hypothetical protein
MTALSLALRALGPAHLGFLGVVWIGRNRM